MFVGSQWYIDTLNYTRLLYTGQDDAQTINFKRKLSEVTHTVTGTDCHTGAARVEHYTSKSASNQSDDKRIQDARESMNAVSEHMIDAYRKAAMLYIH